MKPFDYAQDRLRGIQDAARERKETETAPLVTT
jgi:hypothetical protein